MLAHEFEPETEQRFAGTKQRMQRVRCAALAVPGERHRDDTAEGFRQKRGAAAMGEPVRFAGDEDEGDGVEHAEARPHQQHRRDFALGGNGVYDAAKQDRLRNRDDGEHDVGQHDRRDTELVNRKILERSCIHLEQ
ncbi:hypothetical protein D3C72_1820380 [compost metagenome]